jgi:hypothetical protein
LAASLLSAGLALGASDVESYVGQWALHRARGAGWLELRQEEDTLAGSLLWGGGSVVPLNDVTVEEDRVVLIRKQQTVQKKTKEKVTVISRWEVRLKDGQLVGKVLPSNPKITGEEFIGKRLPTATPAPDLSSVRFAEPIELFNGKDLRGWESLDDRKHAFKAVDGVLVCNPVQPEDGPHVSYGNLKTTRKFEDFRLTLDFNVPKGSNSGVYLRGIYEIQICDSFGKPLDPHNTGGLYSRITPSTAAEKPAGEWQTMDITLCDRHLTVILNGVIIIDNQPVQGVTGGAMTADEFSPGPLYLQGDHGAVTYRNLILRPIIKK